VSEHSGALKASWVIGLILVAAVAAALAYVLVGHPPSPLGAGTPADPRALLWDSRALDLMVQAGVVFAAALGVLVLFRTEAKK
jgi:multisubunit Na+/H+ antiporter MnhB subunit